MDSQQQRWLLSELTLQLGLTLRSQSESGVILRAAVRAVQSAVRAVQSALRAALRTALRSAEGRLPS